MCRIGQENAMEHFEDLSGTTTADGRYRFDAPLGSGAFGVVYRGFDTFLDIAVAIKVFDEVDEDAEVELDAVLDEARIHQLCAHANVARIRDVRVEPPMPLVVMDLYERGSVEALVNDGGAPYADANRLVRGALDGLAHAHELGVLHRDIKPANMLLDDRGNALLSDFGLAEDTVRQRLVSPAVYVPHAAPEILAGKSSSIASDIWAMGATLYRLVTGAYPFTSAAAAAAGEYVPPQRLNPQVPKCLQDIISRALSVEPASRYPSAKAMLADLTNCRAVCSWIRVIDAELETWRASTADGEAEVRLVPRGGLVELEIRLDRGSGFRRVMGSRRPPMSPARARQAMATVMRRVVQGYAAT